MFIFEGGNNYKTVLQISRSGLLQYTKGRINTCADYKKTVIMILNNLSPI